MAADGMGSDRGGNGRAGRDAGRKLGSLRKALRGHQSLAVALSGGTDSTLLAKLAHDELGDAMLAITVAGVATQHGAVDDARAWAAAEGMRHIVIPFDELSVPAFAANAPDRCYHCKKAIFAAMRDVAANAGCTTLADGSNVDDEGDYRPGMRALTELGVVSPLRDAGLTKADVRALSRKLGLPTWNLPATACLASRFAYGVRITADGLGRVGAAEDYLHGLGIAQLRVRVHGNAGELARIEVEPADIARLAVPSARAAVVARLRELGFTYVSLDLAGFRSGAMNELL